VRFISDFITFVGFCLLGTGLCYLYSPELSCCVVGVLLIVYGVFLDLVPWFFGEKVVKNLKKGND